MVDKHCIGGIPGNRTSMLVVPIVAAHGMLIPKTSTRAITSPAGTADTMEVLAEVELPFERLGEIVRAAARLPRVGRHRRPLARRRRADLGRAPAVARLAGADGRVDPVEEDRGGLHAPGARHSARTDRQGALDAGGAEAAEAVRVRRATHFGLTLDVVITDGRQPVGARHRAGARGARRDAGAEQRSARARRTCARRRCAWPVA